MAKEACPGVSVSHVSDIDKMTILSKQHNNCAISFGWQNVVLGVTGWMDGWVNETK